MNGLGRNGALNAQNRLWRVLRIHGHLAAGRSPNAHLLAREMEVSEKTVLRDLDFMRDTLELPIAYVELQYGFRYTAAVGCCPFCWASRRGAFAQRKG